MAPVDKPHKANNKYKANHIELLINPMILFYKDDLNCVEATKLLRQCLYIYYADALFTYKYL